jgi:hypothetical protein
MNQSSRNLTGFPSQYIRGDLVLRDYMYSTIRCVPAAARQLCRTPEAEVLHLQVLARVRSHVSNSQLQRCLSWTDLYL